MADKCTEELKLRLPESLLLQLSRLAHADDRKLSECIRFVLSSHVFGHAVRLDDASEDRQGAMGRNGTHKKMPDFLIPGSPLVSGLLAAAVFAGTWAACRRMRFTKRDDE